MPASASRGFEHYTVRDSANPRASAGGHVEAGETPAEAAVREVMEEAGLHVRLLPGPTTPPPDGFPHQAATASWWVSEMPASADRHTPSRHVHLDHVFLAIAENRPPAHGAAHEVAWFTEASAATAEGISEDSRLQVLALFGYLSGRSRPPAPAACWTGGTGSGDTKLVIVRGNSASGKSSVAAEARRRYGRGIAIVGQDNLRSVVLREHDVPGGANVGLIDLTTRHALSHGFHVIVEGILRADHYGEMLTALISDYAGSAFAYFLDVPFSETLRRHATKPQDVSYGEAEMRRWYRELDLLPGSIEQIIPATSALQATVTTLMADASLEGAPSPRPAP